MASVLTTFLGPQNPSHLNVYTYLLPFVVVVFCLNILKATANSGIIRWKSHLSGAESYQQKMQLNIVFCCVYFLSLLTLFLIFILFTFIICCFITLRLKFASWHFDMNTICERPINWHFLRVIPQPTGVW